MGAVQIILKTALDPVVVADERGVVVDVNDLACELFDRSRSAFVGRTIGETIVPPAMRDAHQAGMTRYVSTGASTVLGKRLELTAINSSGAEFPVELAVTEVRESGRRLFVSYIRDISDRIAKTDALIAARDEAQAASELKSRILAVLSHDLRAPIHGVGCIIDETLGSLESAEVVRSNLRCARRATRNAEVLLEDLLSYAQIESGILSLSLTPIKIRRIKSSLSKVWISQFAAKGLQLSIDFQVDCEAIYWIDEVRLLQIMDNLISNALKYTEKGGASVACRPIDGGLSFTVEDTGAGLPAEGIDLFTAFEQGRKRSPGVGLGLWIVKSLVELYGGRVALEPRSNGGTRAQVDLQIAAGPASPLRSEADARRLAGRSVLLVDDNETNRFVGEQMLASLGVVVTTAVNGRQAVNAVRCGDFDAVFMDLDMPVMDGFEATATIRADGGVARQPAIIALSAFTTQHHQDRIRDAGADDFLEKPVRTADALADVLDRTLSSTPSTAPNQALRPASLAAAAADADGDGDGAATFRASVLHSLADEIGLDTMSVLAEKFVADVAASLDVIAGWPDTSDIAALRRTTHMLDAVAGTLGAERLQESASRLNGWCHAGDVDAVTREARRLGPIASETLSAFAELRAEIGKGTVSDG